GPVELHRLQLGVKLVLLLKELEETVILLGALDELIEVLELLLAVAVEAERELRRARRGEEEEGQRRQSDVPQGTSSHGVPRSCAGSHTEGFRFLFSLPDQFPHLTRPGAGRQGAFDWEEFREGGRV